MDPAVLNTPVKHVNPACLVCYSSQSWRTHKLTDPKCTERNISDKICQSVFDLTESQRKECSICQKCFSRIEKWWEFRSSAIENIQQHATSIDRTKRMYRSPQSPAQTPNLSTKSPKKSRTTLILTTPTSSLPGSPGNLQKIATPITNELTPRLPSSDTQCPRKEEKSKTPLSMSTLLKDRGLQGTGSEKEMKEEILRQINSGCGLLSSRTAFFKPSVLGKNKLCDITIENFALNVMEEIKNRLPFLLEVFLAVACGTREPSESSIWPIITAYCILMYTRNPNTVSAFQKIFTIAAVKGNADDSFIFQLNKIGVTQSPTSKLRLLHEGAFKQHLDLVCELKKNHLAKITDDNEGKRKQEDAFKTSKSHNALNSLGLNKRLPITKKENDDFDKVEVIEHYVEIKPEADNLNRPEPIPLEVKIEGQGSEIHYW